MTTAKLTPEDLRRVWEPWRSKQMLTRHNYHSRLRQTLRSLGVTPALLASVPVVNNQSPRGIIAHANEVDGMLAIARPDTRLFILLCSDEAMRSGTATRIAERDWDGATNHFHFVTKKQAVVTLPATERVAALVAEALRYPAPRDTPLLERLAGKPRAPKWYAYEFQRIRKELGLDRFTPHDLRRSQARRLYEATKDLRLVQNLLGVIFQ